MALKNTNPTQTVAWQKIQLHFETMKNVQMQDLFANDTDRAEKMHLEWNDFLLDYSKNIITDETLKLFQELAEEVHLKEAIANILKAIQSIKPNSVVCCTRPCERPKMLQFL